MQGCKYASTQVCKYASPASCSTRPFFPSARPPSSSPNSCFCNRSILIWPCPPVCYGSFPFKRKYKLQVNFQKEKKLQVELELFFAVKTESDRSLVHQCPLHILDCWHEPICFFATCDECGGVCHAGDHYLLPELVR